jgi:hypothetical protein
VYLEGHKYLAIMAFSGQQYYDPVWEVEVPQSRLANMAPECPIEGPGIGPIVPGDPGSFRTALRAYASQYLHHTDAEERLELWRSLPSPSRVPPWMYLTCADPEDTKYFHKWKYVIKEDLGCDDLSVAAFVELLRTNVPHAPEGGFMEGSRVLAHLFKDKQRSDNWDPGHYNPHNFSKYLMVSSMEATEALEAGKNVWYLQSSTGRSGSSSAWQPSHGRWSSSSWQTSTSTWQPDQGKGTVNGKGNTVGKGAYQMGPVP